MNKIIFLATLTMAAMASQAQDLGRVLSATPITQQVAVPQQVCGNETIYNGARPTTGGGAVLGAIAGGAAGNAIGSGGGRAGGLRAAGDPPLHLAVRPRAQPVGPGWMMVADSHTGSRCR